MTQVMIGTSCVVASTPHMPAEYDVRDVVGLLPSFLDINSDMSMKEQLREGYGMGWHTMQFTVDPETKALQSKDDDDLLPWAVMAFVPCNGVLTKAYVYAYGIVMVDGDIVRMD